MKIQVAIVFSSGLPLVASLASWSCPKYAKAVFADMHDGDMKEITVKGNSITIKPSGNNQTWAVHSDFDRKSCSASIDFNVPGKPGPPPVNLLATLWKPATDTGRPFEFEFTDPSGKLNPDKAFPLNRWVEHDKYLQKMEYGCPKMFTAAYADMHDGDKKVITIAGTDLTIKPFGNDQTWAVKSKFNPQSCTASIDFNVPGKPSPPPVNLQAVVFFSGTSSSQKTEVAFTDPTGTLAPSRTPLNRWVEISKLSGDFKLSV
jgi:hypothetical protein